MSMQWRAEVGHEPTMTLFISGNITETAEFPTLDALADAARRRLDLAGVETINSCGVREWVHFVKLLTRAGRPFELARCSPAIVRQLNTISNFCGAGRVSSVMLPYCCDGCGQEECVELELMPKQPVHTIQQHLTCPACGRLAEFDDLPDTYLGFAAYAALGPALPAGPDAPRPNHTL